MSTVTDTPASPVTCAFVRSDGSLCPGPVEGEGDLCFWHDPQASKETDDVRRRLEEWADTGESMEGFVLRFGRLEGLQLSNRPSTDMRNADLFKTRLQGASLWKLDLTGADLSKADLAGANLNESQMVGTDLLGTNFDGSRLERVEWGDKCTNELRALEALREGRTEDACAAFEEAEEIYRILRRSYDGAGRFEAAGHFFSREMTMRRMLLPRWSVGRAWSRTVDLFCAYGESPPRVIGSAALLNLLCAVIYFAVGVKGPDGRIGFDIQAGIGANVLDYLNCVYYSVVTFTTRGYGDITPSDGLARPLAALQAFAGAFMMAMFVAVFGKKMTRG